MADTLDQAPVLSLEEIGDAREAISTLAWTHGVTAEPEPVDAFVDDATRLCSNDVQFDHIELLLLGLARAEVITDEQRLALHGAYIHQRAADLRYLR